MAKRKSLESNSDPVKSEGNAEDGKKFLKDTVSRSNTRTDTQAQFAAAKVSFETYHIYNGNFETIKIAKIEVLPNGDAHRSFAARLAKQKGKWILKVGTLNDEMKKALKDRERITI